MQRSPQRLTLQSFFRAWLGVHAMALMLVWDQMRSAYTYLASFFTAEPVLQAIQRGATCREVGRLVLAGADLSETDDKGRTALHVALERLEDAVDEEAEEEAAERLELVLWLVHQQPDVSARDQQYRTPMHVAVKAGFHEVVRCLADAGADPTAACKGVSSLRQATVRRDVEMVELLLERAALAASRAGGGAASPSLEYVNHVGPDGWSALALAARAGDGAIVKALLAAGADRTAVGASGKSALEIARLNGKTAIVELLEASPVSSPSASSADATPGASAGRAVPRRSADAAAMERQS